MFEKIFFSSIAIGFVVSLFIGIYFSIKSAEEVKIKQQNERQVVSTLTCDELPCFSNCIKHPISYGECVKICRFLKLEREF